MKLNGATAIGIEKQMPAIGHAQYVNVTGALAVACTLSPSTAWQFESIRIHLSAAGGAGDLTATIDHHLGPAYDFNPLTQDMTSETDVIYSPERPMEFRKGDRLVIAWANGNSRTYGLEIVWKER